MHPANLIHTNLHLLLAVIDVCIYKLECHRILVSIDYTALNPCNYSYGEFPWAFSLIAFV